MGEVLGSNGDKVKDVVDGVMVRYYIRRVGDWVCDKGLRGRYGGMEGVGGEVI
jgi:hypothetical protein